jgi:hypothetical protein
MKDRRLCPVWWQLPQMRVDVSEGRGGEDVGVGAGVLAWSGLGINGSGQIYCGKL